MSAILDDLLRAKVQLAGAAPENADVLANLLRSRLNVTADGTVRVVDGHGNIRVGGGPHYGDMSLDEAVAEMAASKPSLFRPRAVAEPEKPAEAETVTARAAREGRERQVPAPKSSGFEPNPYTRAGWNVTAQVLMQHREPEKAERFRREAASMPSHLDRPFLDIRQP